jgi:dienelactone hydrolase
MKSIFDDMRCVDLLQARPDVDPERIGVLGQSLGGHSSMFVGAFDTRLKVIVSSSGWTLMDFYNLHSVTPDRNEAAIKKYGNRLGPWAQDVYMPLIRDKYNYENIPFDFDEVISAIAPRAFFSNSPLKDRNYDVRGVRKGIEAASEVYHFLGAKAKLQVRYPDSGHGFSSESRTAAYNFIDKVLKHVPIVQTKIED